MLVLQNFKYLLPLRYSKTLQGIRVENKFQKVTKSDHLQALDNIHLLLFLIKIYISIILIFPRSLRW